MRGGGWGRKKKKKGGGVEIVVWCTYPLLYRASVESPRYSAPRARKAFILTLRVLFIYQFWIEVTWSLGNTIYYITRPHLGISILHQILETLRDTSPETLTLRDTSPKTLTLRDTSPETLTLRDTSPETQNFGIPFPILWDTLYW